MATATYARLTPSEGLLNVVGDVVMAGYELREVLCDARFTSRLSLRSLKCLNTPFMMRFRTNGRVIFEAQKVRVKERAKRFAPGKARYYPKLDRYVKRLEVPIEEVGVVDLLMVWKRQALGWYLTVLVSTLKAGVQEVMTAWNARWALEVTHRQRKQDLALGACQSRKYATHLKHADLATDAFNLAREERRRQSGIT